MSGTVAGAICTAGGAVCTLAHAAFVVDPAAVVPLRVVDPSVVATPSVRAAAAFLLTILFGGAAIYRYGNRLGSAVEASVSRPVAAVLYGIAAYGLLAFVVGYAATQLFGLGVGGRIVSAGSALVAGCAVLSLGGFGFAVVGTWLTGRVGGRDPWFGLVGLAALSAAVWFLAPPAVGAAVWLGIAAFGVGGSTRRWIHLSE